MVRQQLKDVYFALTRHLSLVNHVSVRHRYRQASKAEGLYLHLGCGVTYIPGMINIDGNVRRKTDAWLDLRNGLPFPTESAFFIYTCHTIEHLYPDEAIRLIREMHRVLKNGHLARVAVPSMEHAMMIAAGSAQSEWPRRFSDSLGQAINYLFCDGQHKYGYSYGSIAELALSAGFSDVSHYSRENGVTPKRYGKVLVGDEPAGSLVVELVK